MPFDEDASDVPMATIDQDHAALPANDEPRRRSRTKDQRYPVLARGTSVPRRGLACIALALLASLSSHTVVGAVVLIFLPSVTNAQSGACGIGHLVTVEPDGTVSRGTKEQLRRAVANGIPLRVGWSIDANADGVAGVSHWTDALFITAFEGEVFTQIADIQRQTPTRGQARVLMPAGRQRWTGLLGTNGILEGHFEDGPPPNSIRVRSTWCVDPRAASCAMQWRLVYRHDANGAPLGGSKQALLDTVRRGAPVRIAWGFSGSQAERPISVEHSAAPVFLTIMNGDVVFVQLTEHIGQASYSQPDQARFDHPLIMWRGLMGSDGTFDAVFVDRSTGKEIRRLPQRAGLAWFAELPPPEYSDQSPPYIGRTRRRTTAVTARRYRFRRRGITLP